MKRFFAAIALVGILVSSCGKDGLYISLDGTFWQISTDEQRALVCFMDDENASTIQDNFAQGYMQTRHGLYSVDGHSVDITPADGNASVHMIRTFSHLKNSNNKNLSGMGLCAPEHLPGSVWATMEDGNFHFAYFTENGTCKGGTFKNVTHAEGYSYGWEWQQTSYNQSGSLVQLGSYSGRFYNSTVLILDKLAVPCVSVLQENTGGTSSLKGTVWTYQTSSYPGIILFTSSTEFTRILVQNNIIFGYQTGTYSLKGNSLAMEAGELSETCVVSDGAFTFLEKTYKLERSF